MSASTVVLSIIIFNICYDVERIMTHNRYIALLGKM